MTSPLRVPKTVVDSIHALAYLSAHENQVVPLPRIAQLLEMSVSNLGKAMKRLGKAGLAKPTKGPGGGFTATDKTAGVTVQEIWELLEGPIRLQDCTFEKGHACRNIEGECVFRDLLTLTMDGIKTLLGMTIADLAKGSWLENIDIMKGNY